MVIYRFVTENSVEERIIDKAERKLKLDHLVIQQGNSIFVISGLLVTGSVPLSLHRNLTPGTLVWFGFLTTAPVICIFLKQ